MEMKGNTGSLRAHVHKNSIFYGSNLKVIFNFLEIIFIINYYGDYFLN